MVREKHQRVVVAGGSLAGHAVVSELDRRGFSGEVVWVMGEEGVLPYSKPALSKEFMQGKIGLEGLSLPPVTTENIRLRRLDNASCESLDPERDRVRVAGEWVPFDALFLCTGLRARVPRAFAGISGVHPLRTRADALAIRERLAERPRTAIVGGGLIGSEVAAALRSLGLPVELVVQGELPLEPLLGKELGQFCLDQHQEHGVSVRVGATVTELRADRKSGEITVCFEDDRATVADLVVLGLGATTACDWLQGAGLEISDGVRCDAGLRTARPRVFAAGDIASWPNPVFGRRMRVEHWTNASAQGRHAVGSWLATLEGRESVPFADVPYFWSDQYGLKYQMVGHAHGHDDVRVDLVGAEERPFATYYRQGELVAAAGVNATRRVMQTKARIQSSTIVE